MMLKLPEPRRSWVANPVPGMGLLGFSLSECWNVTNDKTKKHTKNTPPPLLI